MNLYLESEIDISQKENYNSFEFDNRTYFYDKEYLKFKGQNFGEKTPNINLVLKKLEEVYKTNFILMEIESRNIFRLSTQVVARNIRLTDIDLPNLETEKIKCEFRKIESYKIKNGNTKINLIVNLIEYILKDGTTYFESFDYEKDNKLEQFKILKSQLTNEELLEVNKELLNRDLKII